MKKAGLALSALLASSGALYAASPADGLAALDYIPLADAGSAAISVRAVLATGNVRDGYVEADQSVDLKAGDLYTQALDQIVYRASAVLREQDLRLLEKPRWNHDDRLEWERELAQAVLVEAHKIPGLRQYRIVDAPGFSDIDAKYRVASRRTFRLNDLANDIAVDGHEVDYSCARQAVTEGIVAQRVEDALLPAAGADADDARHASPWFIATGHVHMASVTGSHEFLVSGATGSIIEATSEGNSDFYFQSAEEDWNLSAFVAGRPFIAADEDFAYEDENFLLSENIIQSRMSAIASGDFGLLRDRLFKEQNSYTVETSVIRQKRGELQGEQRGRPHLEKAQRLSGELSVAMMDFEKSAQLGQMTPDDRIQRQESIARQANAVFQMWNNAADDAKLDLPLTEAIENSFNFWSGQLEPLLDRQPPSRSNGSEPYQNEGQELAWLIDMTKKTIYESKSGFGILNNEPSMK